MRYRLRIRLAGYETNGYLAHHSNERTMAGQPPIALSKGLPNQIAVGKCSMSQFFQRKPARRAPRANLQGMISAGIRLQNGRQISCKLRQLSITGGLLDASTYVEERTWVKLTIYLSTGAVNTVAEMMFPMRGGAGFLQPFRFTSLGSEELLALDREVTFALNQTVNGKTMDSGLRAPRFYLESF